MKAVGIRHSILLLIGILILLAADLHLQGQSLSNSAWIRIKAERKDGSRIIARSSKPRDVLADSPVKLSFGDTVLVTSYDGEFSNNYRVDKKVLSIGYFDSNRFNPEVLVHIDSISNIILILSEAASDKLTDDKINRYVYVSARYYLQYLIANKEISITGDSVIQCNKLIIPYYKGNIDHFLNRQLAPVKKNESIWGHFIFAADGTIKQLNIERTENLSNERIAKFRSVLLSTNGQWKMPVNTVKYYLKLDFSCSSFALDGKTASPLNTVMAIRYNINDFKHPNNPILPAQEIKTAALYYNKGVRLVQHQKYRDAITNFQRCLDIDSLHIDAYYNKAYAHYSLKETNLACDTWKKLSDLGQKQGEKLFKENCK